MATVPTPNIDPKVDSSDSFFFPLSLDVSINPLSPEEFTYNIEKIANNQTVITMSLNEKNAELYTMAIWGRVFEWDGDTASPPIQDGNDEGDKETETEDNNDVVDGEENENAADSSIVAVTNKTLMLLVITLLFLRK